MINYTYIFGKINEAKDSNYNINELQKIAWKINFSEIDDLIEEDNLFYENFSELLYYFDIEAINDKNLKEIIDDLVMFSGQNKLNRYDILYILNKKSIMSILEKYNEEKISLDIVKNQLKKYLKLSVYNDIKSLLLKYQINISTLK